MRICFLNPHGYLAKQPPLGKTDTGGQIVYILELAKALSRQGVSVDIVTRQFDARPQVEEVAANAQIIRIPCGPNAFVVKEKLYELIPEMVDRFCTYAEENKLQYDVIHSHYWDGGYAGMLLHERWNVPHFFTPHSLGKWKELEMAPLTDPELAMDGPPLLSERGRHTSLHSASDGPFRTPHSALPTPHSALDYRHRKRIAIENKIIRSADMVLMLSQVQKLKLIQHYSVHFDR